MNFALWIIALPAMGALLLRLGGQRLAPISALCTAAVLLVSVIFSVILVRAAAGLPSSGLMDSAVFSWITLQGRDFGLGIALDRLSVGMALLVAVLATLVAVFSSWYMAHDPRRWAYYPSFLFFVAAMQALVLADGLVASFLAWEWVGLGSYLLIGFWREKPSLSADAEALAARQDDPDGVVARLSSPAVAQLKAFVVNRVGDACFLLGIALLPPPAGIAPALAHISCRGKRCKSACWDLPQRFPWWLMEQ